MKNHKKHVSLIPNVIRGTFDNNFKKIKDIFDSQYSSNCNIDSLSIDDQPQNIIERRRKKSS